MQDLDDNALLQEYVEHDSEAAFAAIVARHVNKVYSVALRHTLRPHQAEGITQAVFVILAKKSRQLSKAVVLSGWLYQTARLAALTFIRGEIRRADREKEAHMQVVLDQSEPDLWPQIAPALDEAMAGLSEADRNAIVLRYFDNKSMREVGTVLGTTENAAKMRLTRAVEKLRTFFAKRGVTLSAGVLVASISANSVQAAPSVLAAAILAATAKGAVVASTVTALVNGTIKTILMTTVQKTLIAATVIVALSAGIYEGRQASLLQAQVTALENRGAPGSDQSQQFQKERDDALRQLAALRAENQSSHGSNSELLKLRGEVARLRREANQADDPTQAAVKEWVNRVSQLKQRLQAHPETGIPELEFLDEEDWLAAVKNQKLDSEKGYRRAMSTLRDAAEAKAGSFIHEALQKYLEANGKKFPTELTELQSFFDTPISAAVLERWQIAPAKTVPNIGVGDPIITQRWAVDDVLDSRQVIGSSGRGSTDFLNSMVSDLLKPVYAAADKEAKSEKDDYFSVLLSHATTPEQASAIQKLREQDGLRR
jgi:RNA polymerase sigma factor (sigma-70 family)